MINLLLLLFPLHLFTPVESIDEFIHCKAEENRQEAFHVIDARAIVEQINLWNECFPDIFPYYAVKVNPDPALLEVFASVGMGFDCASLSEIAQVLKLGVPPHRILFANPIKPKSSIQFAQDNQVNKMTFDSADELVKMHSICPGGHFLLRLKVDDSESGWPLGTKFGANLQEAKNLIAFAKSNGIAIEGLSFHVGCSCKSPSAFRNALLDAAEIYQFAKSQGIDFQVIDLGGGWPGNDEKAFREIAHIVNETLKMHFDQSVTFIAEPGTFFSCKSTTLLTQIIAKKKMAGDQVAYYLSDGIYGLLSCAPYYGRCAFRLFEEGWEISCLNTSCNYTKSVLYGPTCDSGDRIVEGIYLPESMPGDWIVWKNIGAYGQALSSDFNQISPSKGYYIISNH